MLGLGFMVVAAYLLHSLFRGAPAPANPWGERHPGVGDQLAAAARQLRRGVRGLGDPYDIESLEYDPAGGGYRRHDPSAIRLRPAAAAR